VGNPKEILGKMHTVKSFGLKYKYKPEQSCIFSVRYIYFIAIQTITMLVWKQYRNDFQ